MAATNLLGAVVFWHDQSQKKDYLGHVVIVYDQPHPGAVPRIAAVDQEGRVWSAPIEGVSVLMDTAGNKTPMWDVIFPPKGVPTEEQPDGGTGSAGG